VRLRPSGCGPMTGGELDSYSLRAGAGAVIGGGRTGPFLLTHVASLSLTAQQRCGDRLHQAWVESGRQGYIYVANPSGLISTRAVSLVQCSRVRSVESYQLSLCRARAWISVDSRTLAAGAPGRSPPHHCRIERRNHSPSGCGCP